MLVVMCANDINISKHHHWDYLPDFLSSPRHFVHSFNLYRQMARVWSRTIRSSRLLGTNTSSSFSSGRQGGRRLSSTNIDDDADHVEASLELEGILEGIGHTVETLPWDIALSSSDDGNTESCIVPNGITQLDTEHNVNTRNSKATDGDESALETKLCQLMDVMEQGLPHCMEVVNDNATDGIFPIEAEKYQGVQSIGSLHSM